MVQASDFPVPVPHVHNELASPEAVKCISRTDVLAAINEYAFQSCCHSALLLASGLPHAS